MASKSWKSACHEVNLETMFEITAWEKGLYKLLYVGLIVFRSQKRRIVAKCFLLLADALYPCDICTVH